MGCGGQVEGGVWGAGRRWGVGGVWGTGRRWGVGGR